MSRRIALLFALFAAVPLFAQTQYTMTPNRGPVAGGTEVTIKGEFGTWSYGVIFGSVAVPATRVDDTTLRATTPAHLPGRVDITIFEYDIRLATGLKFTFEGKAEDGFEPLLLPFFTHPIPGAHGSAFVTELRARLARQERVDIYGLYPPCIVTCIFANDQPYTLNHANPEIGPDDIDPNGTPGRLLYVPKDQANRAILNLRAFDTSRDAENFGTELPIVRGRDFAKDYDSIMLIGIPSDPRFRNTLRIYSLGDTGASLSVAIEGENGAFIEHAVYLPGQQDLFSPGYVELTNFPTGVGRIRVTIDVVVPPISAPIPPSDRWAFVSVTNNETQHITLITPQP